MKRWAWLPVVIVLFCVAGRSPSQSVRPEVATKIDSKAAMAAEAEYLKEVAKAEAAFKERVGRARDSLVSRLESAKEEAAKAVKIDLAVAIRDRIKELGDQKPGGPESAEPKPHRDLAEAVQVASPERKARRDLAEAIQDVVWVGSPHGQVTFDRSGLIKTSRPNQKPWRWEAVDKNTVVARFEDGNIDVFFFDLRRGVVLSYGFGIPKQENFAWEGRRVGGQ